MQLDVLIEDPRWEALGLAALAETAAAATFALLGFDAEGWELSLMGCDDARIAALNTEFRDKPRPTNVLSWPAQERVADAPGGTPEAPEPEFPGMPVELGDIAIAFETCQREAEEAGKPMSDHVTHLIVHGVLHLLGYDHIDDADAALMEGLEVRILAKLGLPDPYSA
ncbi:Endoribonuclease YbeY [Pseudoruegeria aquimaris]|uniref:Endoribonuclease YbeY n=1 Tax=Pseudoruegeria aquimaris TaxID=393663 RepID=A0A1Y5TNS6_9RHOB|nr:rRNA maturation RNase YbeY [Pseudoruegeria aquimaris]SLN64605.1 Endoribonuclease YbeY [Pseudoruegeria aquimaris]